MKKFNSLKALSDRLRALMPSIGLDDIQPMTAFLRDAKGHAKQLQKSRRPVVLTVNGKASIVVQSAEAYQAMAKALDLAEQEITLQQAMAEGDAGLGVPLDEAMEKIYRKRRLAKPGIPKAA